LYFACVLHAAVIPAAEEKPTTQQPAQPQEPQAPQPTIATVQDDLQSSGEQSTPASSSESSVASSQEDAPQETTQQTPTSEAPMSEPQPTQSPNAYIPSVGVETRMIVAEQVDTMANTEVAADEQTTESMPPQMVEIVRLAPMKAQVHATLPVYNKAADYDFSYSVNDNFSGDIKSQSEMRRGNTVSGTYSLIDADGFRRIVDYRADDKNGFTAEIRREPVINLNPIVAPAPTVILPSAEDNAYRYIAPVYTSVSQIRSTTDDELPQEFDSQFVYTLPSDETYYY
jgi:Insect cuticle protein